MPTQRRLRKSEERRGGTPVPESRKGYRYHVTEEQVRRYSALSPREKLEWLEEVNAFVDRFLPEEGRRFQRMFRRGEI